MKKTSIGACLGFIIGLIVGAIIQPLLMEAMNITIPVDPLNFDILKLTIAFFVPIPGGVILGSIIGYLVVANIEKLKFYRIQQIKRKNYTTDAEFFEGVGKTFKANYMN